MNFNLTKAEVAVALRALNQTDWAGEHPEDAQRKAAESLARKLGAPLEMNYMRTARAELTEWTRIGQIPGARVVWGRSRGPMPAAFETEWNKIAQTGEEAK